MSSSFRLVFVWAVSGGAGCDAPAPDPPPPPPPIFSQPPVETKPPVSRRELPSVEPTKSTATPIEPAMDARLVRVTDGDTIVVTVDGKQERVRLIGIDTPETKHSPRGAEPLADEATAALRTLLRRHPLRLRLRLDAEERDRYGRLLAYVYANGVFVNEAMVRDGWARALRIPPNVRHAKTFDRLADEARRRRLGIWATSN
ncbi:MAG: thermonuclease family protein [Nannocystales bacterium]